MLLVQLVFFHLSSVRQVGLPNLNYEDHLDRISECDWVVEVISERLEWKQELYRKIQPYLKQSTIVTSNTSGISAKELISKMDDEMASNFFITHFFNPPRYMKLVEIINGKKTTNETTEETIELTDPKAVAEALGLNEKKKKENEPQEIEEEIDFEALETGKKK